MKTAIKGRLGNKPELNEVKTAKGEKFKVVRFTLFVADATRKTEKDFMATAPFRMTAYNERAETISKMEPGDILTGIADLRVKTIQEDGQDTTIAVWNMTKIDPENKLAEQQTKLITAYGKGDIDNLDIGLAGQDFLPTRETESDLPFEATEEKGMEE